MKAVGFVPSVIFVPEARLFWPLLGWVEFSVPSHRGRVWRRQRSTVGTQWPHFLLADLVSLHFTWLRFADTVFYKWKAFGSPVFSKSVGTITLRLSCILVVLQYFRLSHCSYIWCLWLMITTCWKLRWWLALLSNKIFFKLRYVFFFLDSILLYTNELQYSVNLTFICTGKPRTDALCCGGRTEPALSLRPAWIRSARWLPV